MKKVLVIVDCQMDFLDPNGSLYLGHDTTGLIKRISQFINNFDGDLVYTQDWHEEEDVEFTQFPKHCVEDTWGSDIIPEINEADIMPNHTSIVFTKKGYTDTQIPRFLSSYAFQDKDAEFHFVGVCTHICVLDIISSLVNEIKEVGRVPYLPKIIVHKDMVDDFNPEMAEFALKRMQSLYNVTLA